MGKQLNDLINIGNIYSIYTYTSTVIVPIALENRQTQQCLP